MRDFAAGKRGRLDIAVAPLVAASSLPHVLVRYRNAHPNIKLRIYDELSNVCAEMVRTGMAEVAIMPERRQSSDLTQQILFRDPLVVLCAPNHPLTAFSDVQWSDIIVCDLIVRGSDSSVRQLVETHYLKHGVMLQPAYEVNHIGTSLSLIAAGLGISVVPFSLINTVNMTGLTYRHFKKGTESYWIICVSTSNARSNSPAAQFFIDICLEHFA